MAKAKWKTILPTILSYTLFVFLSILIVLTLRSASLIWIHDLRMIGYTPFELFKREFYIATIISAIQTPIMLLFTLIYFLIRHVCSLRQIAIATLLLCILDLFIRPISIWTMNFRILGLILTIGTILIFPLFAWLAFFFAYDKHHI
jgi:hypothetical protein